MIKVGVISDTHSLLRESAVQALQGVDHILHVGDVCEPGILDSLQNIAPINTVRGNCDYGKWADAIPITEALEIGGCWIYMIHNLQQLDLNPSGQFQVVLHGHTHVPDIRQFENVLYFNPGSAGPRRFGKPISIGFLEIENSTPSAKWLEIEK
jgi:putative phosphoesterase